MTGLDTVHAQIPTGHTHLHGHTHMPQPRADQEDILVSSLRGLLVVLALSVHELFEGLAVGLESSSGTVWYMFGAVAAHKLVLAFCVGVELVVTRTRGFLAVIYVTTFAAVSPIGIGIGIGVSASGDASATSVPSAILQGLATGTLLSSQVDVNDFFHQTHEEEARAHEEFSCVERHLRKMSRLYKSFNIFCNFWE
uniref:Uncharacterized protein n=1 Tax=Phlebotomus papatasi TaxID=29031 RepID=A0A1B0DNN5_PHLPP